jgi:hypothetical protein
MLLGDLSSLKFPQIGAFIRANRETFRKFNDRQ